MKNKIQNSVFLLIAFLAFNFTLTAQTGAPNSNRSFFDVDIPSFFNSAVQVNKEYPTARQIAGVNPRGVNSAALDAVKRGRNLLDRILRTNGRMSNQQANSFIQELQALEAQIDRSQKPEPKTCHGKCNHDFPGWGKGMGWQRFWCKIACIKINFGGGGAQGQ